MSNFSTWYGKQSFKVAQTAQNTQQELPPTRGSLLKILYNHGFSLDPSNIVLNPLLWLVHLQESTICEWTWNSTPSSIALRISTAHSCDIGVYFWRLMSPVRNHCQVVCRWAMTATLNCLPKAFIKTIMFLSNLHLENTSRQKPLTSTVLLLQIDDNFLVFYHMNDANCTYIALLTKQANANEGHPEYLLSRQIATYLEALSNGWHSFGSNLLKALTWKPHINSKQSVLAVALLCYINRLLKHSKAIFWLWRFTYGIVPSSFLIYTFPLITATKEIVLSNHQQQHILQQLFKI